MDYTKIRVKERSVTTSHGLSDKELLLLRDMYKDGYIGRFTLQALNKECKRRGLEVKP